jgi:hypothetical protein
MTEEDLKKLRVGDMPFDIDQYLYLDEQQQQPELTPEDRALMIAQQGQQMITSQGGGNPFHPAQTWDDKAMHRMLTVKMPKNEKEKCNLWTTESEFIEQFGLLNLPKIDFDKFVRMYRKIENLCKGEGNSEIVKSRQRKLAQQVIMYKSRGDNPLIGITERGAWITTRNELQQVVKMPMVDNRQGFIGGIKSRIFGR